MIIEGIEIIASEGMMLTNGIIYASSIRLGDWDNADNYYEITKEEYEEIIQSQIPVDEVMEEQ